MRLGASVLDGGRVWRGDGCGGGSGKGVGGVAVIEFDRNNATAFDVLTYVAKVANSPTMFGDQWRIIEAFGHPGCLISMAVCDGTTNHVFAIGFAKRFGVFEYTKPEGQESFLHRIQYFVDRLNNLKRDEEGRMS